MRPSNGGPLSVTGFLSQGPVNVAEMERCKHGHPLEGPDADVRIDSSGRRWCRYCVRRRSIEYRRRKFGPPKTYPTICSVEGCERDRYAKGLCSLHYGRAYRHGDPSVRLRSENAGRACGVDGCEREAQKLGMCQFHYKRQHVGRPLDAPYRDPNRTIKERLFEKVRADENDCWIWTGATYANGTRGSFGYRDGTTTPAYRAMYEELEGPIPEGLTLDHLCLNPLCVNPGHLEPCTRSENTRRQWETMRRASS